jgi:hypothetical protein
MDIHTTIRSQYLAALEMLKGAIRQCPDSLWNDPADRNPFWYVAFHALFFTHYYLQDSENDFQPRPGLPDEREDMNGKFVSRAGVLDYLSFCQDQVNERVPQMDLGAPSGFGRRRFDKLELQLYSMRHIQQHVGELMERLGSRGQVELEVDWVGAGLPSSQ